MSLKPKQTTSLVTVLGSTGDLRMEVPEGTEHAVFREYETKDGDKGSKWELVFETVSGFITNIEFFEGKFGDNIILTFSEEGAEDIKLSLGTASPFGEDVLQKLPNVNLKEYVTFRPYSFEADGKTRKGVTIMQGDTKIMSHYFDGEKNTNGIPEPEGDTKKFKSDDWKMHFMTVRKFLVEKVNNDIIPNMAANRPDSLKAPSAEEVPFEN